MLKIVKLKTVLMWSKAVPDLFNIAGLLYMHKTFSVKSDEAKRGGQ